MKSNGQVDVAGTARDRCHEPVRSTPVRAGLPGVARGARYAKPRTPVVSVDRRDLDFRILVIFGAPARSRK